MPLNTIALELVPPNLDLGVDHARAEAGKVLRYADQSGITGQIRHVMVPGMIAEDDDRPVEMKPKFDVLDYWSLISPQLPGVSGLCTQVTSFLGEPALRDRVTALKHSGIDVVIFVGIPRTMNDGDGDGVAPSDALSMFSNDIPHRGAIPIPTRDGELDRFAAKCNSGATAGMTQLLYSDAVVDFLNRFAQYSPRRPEVLLSFGFVPRIERRIGLIDWLIRDAGNPGVAKEQAFVRELSAAEPAAKLRLLLDLYRRIIDDVLHLGFP